MHEYKIVKDTVEGILRDAKKENAKRIKRVRVSIGEKSHATKESFELYFKELTKNTIAENAQLEIGTRSGALVIVDAFDIE